MSRRLRDALAGVPDWYLDAACAEVDHDMWFPEQGESNTLAKSVCARCPVRVECLNEAIRHESSWGQFGVWGGLSATERKALKRAS